MERHLKKLEPINDAIDRFQADHIVGLSVIIGIIYIGIFIANIDKILGV